MCCQFNSSTERETTLHTFLFEINNITDFSKTIKLEHAMINEAKNIVYIKEIHSPQLSFSVPRLLTIHIVAVTPLVQSKPERHRQVKSKKINFKQET